MTTRKNLVLLALLAAPSTYALEVQVRTLEGSPSQINRSNQVRAGIVATGYNWLPYTMGAGFTLTCSFSSPQEIREQQPKNVAGGEHKLFVPGGDYAAEGTYHIANFETIPSTSCPVCTLQYTGIVTSGLAASFSGSGGGISFGGSGPLEMIRTQTFQMCPAGSGGGGGGSGC